MKSGSQKMLMMVKKKRGFLNLTQYQCLFWLEGRETWKKAMIMRKSFISKSELCAYLLRRIWQLFSTQRTNSCCPLKLRKGGSSSESKSRRPPLKSHLGMPLRRLVTDLIARVHYSRDPSRPPTLCTWRKRLKISGMKLSPSMRSSTPWVCFSTSRTDRLKISRDVSAWQ